MGLPTGLVIKSLLANVGDTGDSGSIPGSGRSPRGGNGNPLQYSCLENLVDRGASWAFRVGHDLATEHTPHAVCYLYNTLEK